MQNICILSNNTYICRQNRRKKTNENIYSKYKLVVAPRTTQVVVRDEDLYMYFSK